MTAQLERLVADVIQSAEEKHRSDFELLDDFTRLRDARAFETLVRRHGPAVLATCQKVLPGADSDDAFQAAFLALIRHAPHIRTAVGGWLITVAHRIAVRMRAGAQRRAAIEANHDGPAGDPRDPSWREACSVLHQELDSLPDGYRRPIVLCYLSGLTRDEAARQLGLTTNAVKGRLERGRLRLRRKLAMRGISLSAGLLAAAVAEPSSAAAIPARLVRAAAAGAIEPSPTVAALARTAASAGVSALWLRAAGLGLAAAVLVAGVALGLPGRSPRDESPKKDMPAQKAPKPDARPGKPLEETARTVSGKVVDPDGRPAAGAEMIYLPVEGKPVLAGKTAADGTYRVTVPLKSPGAWLFARLPGFGSDFLMPATNTPADHTFTLVKDVPLRGRLVGTEGKPVAGASVVVTSIAGLDEKSLDEFLAAWLKRDAWAQSMPARGSVWWHDSAPRELPDGRALFSAKTAADGRFEIAHVGGERIVTLSVRGPGIARSEALVITRDGFDPAPYNRSSQEKLKQDEHGLSYHPMFHSPTANIVVETEKPIRGVVKEADTGKPLAGVKVRLKQGWRLRLPEPTAVTDAAGRYEIRGAAKAEAYELSVGRDVNAGLLGRTVKVRDTVAFEPVSADIGLAKGIVLTGRVLDAASGKSVPGFACVGVLVDNEFIKSRPEYSSPDSYDFANTDANGVFRTVVPPGPVLLMGGPHPAEGGRDVYFKYQQLKPDPDYPQYFEPKMSAFLSPGGGFTMMQGMYCKVLKLKPDQKEVTADVVLKRASEFRIKIQDAAGKPLSGVKVAGTTSRDWMYPEDYKGDSFVVYDLENAKPRLLTIFAPGPDLVGTLTLTGAEKQPAVATLGPTGSIRGKVVNQAGQPIASTRLQLSYFDRVGDEIDRARRQAKEERGQAIETDAKGEFEIRGVVPGLQFLVYGRRGARFLEPPKRTREAAYIAKAGETIDLGTVTLKDE